MLGFLERAEELGCQQMPRAPGPRRACIGAPARSQEAVTLTFVTITSVTAACYIFLMLTVGTALAGGPRAQIRARGIASYGSYLG